MADSVYLNQSAAMIRYMEIKMDVPTLIPSGSEITRVCCCLTTPLTLASGGGGGVRSVRRGLSSNAWVTTWCVCGHS